MVISHEEWMKQTAVFGRTRSAELKTLDAALKDFHSSEEGKFQKRKALVTALEAWKSAKGKDWRSSIRNKTKAVEKLDAELSHVITFLVLDAKEIAARKAVKQQQQENLRLLFQGKKLVVRNTAVASTANDVRSTLGEFKSAAEAAKAVAKPVALASKATIQNQVTDLLKALLDVKDVAAAQAILGAPVYTEFVASVTPYIGLLKSGGGALVGWISTAKKAWDKHKAAESREAFAPGDPQAAFDAVLRIMQREVNASAAGAGIETATFSAQALLAGVDLGVGSGPIVGAANSLAKLALKIYQFARDYKETKAANDLIAAGKLDLGLFGTCPLLGCYLIACSDTSDVIAFAVSDFGKVGWKLDVEVMVKKAKPVNDKAREVIQASRYEIPELRHSKGATADTTGRVGPSSLGKIELKPLGKLKALKQNAVKKIDGIGT